jgi:hypothetical protein
LWKVARAAGRMGPRAISYVLRGAGAPDRNPSRRGWRWVAGASIGLEKAPTHFGARRCEPILTPSPQNAMMNAMRGADADALSPFTDI